MNTEKIVKESKVILVISLIVGIALLSAGIIFELTNAHIVPSNKALIGLSFIPLGVSLTYYMKLRGIVKSPEKMRSIIISENDERLIAIKNEANAKAFRILKEALLLSYMGYTLMVPKDIFESVGWWLLMALFFIAFMSQGILLAVAMRKHNSEKDDE